MSIILIHSCPRGGLLPRFLTVGGIVTHFTGDITLTGCILRGMIPSIMTHGTGAIPITILITTIIMTGRIVRLCMAITLSIHVVAARLRAVSTRVRLHPIREAVPRCLPAV